MNYRNEIINIISELVGEDNIREYLLENDDMTPLDINSIKFIRLVVELEKKFDIEFRDEDLDYNKFISLNSLCEYVQLLKQNDYGE